jgi:RNA polymerase sigma-70 factor, ECF subfamily
MHHRQVGVWVATLMSEEGGHRLGKHIATCAGVYWVMVDGDGAFEDFFRREFVAQTRVAYLIVGDEDLAREIAQEAFARALLRWSRVGGYERPGAWVRLVCVRLAVRSRDRRRREVPTATPLDHGRRELERDLDLPAMLLTLPTNQRTVVVLHHLCDLPMDEVAKALRIRPSTARVHLARARATLAARMTEEVPDGAT